LRLRPVPIEFDAVLVGVAQIQRLAHAVIAGPVERDAGLDQPPPPGTTGLFHTAILYPTRPALADALHRVIAAGIELDGASDHGVSEALYLRDPDQNGVELYRDRPKEEWPRAADGSLSMFTKRLDLEDLLRAREA